MLATVAGFHSARVARPAFFPWHSQCLSGSDGVVNHRDAFCNGECSQKLVLAVEKCLRSRLAMQDALVNAIEKVLLACRIAHRGPLDGGVQKVGVRRTRPSQFVCF